MGVLRFLGLLVMTVIVGTVAAPADDNGAGAAAKPAAAPIAIPFKVKTVVFTMALGPDVATNAKLANYLAYWLRPKLPSGAVDPDLTVVHKSFIVPQATWTLNDLIEQCRRDPAALGAFIALPPAVANGNKDHFVLRRSWTNVTATVIAAQCETPPEQHTLAIASPSITPTGRPTMIVTRPPMVVQAIGAQSITAQAPDSQARTEKTPLPLSVVWVSESYLSEGHHTTFTGLFPLAALVTLYTALAPTRTIQTTRTTVFPTTPPIPVTGTLASVAVQNTSAANSQSAGSAGSALTTAFLTYTTNSAGLPNVDSQLDEAARGATFYAVQQMKIECNSTSPPAFCGW